MLVSAPYGSLRSIDWGLRSLSRDSNVNRRLLSRKSHALRPGAFSSGNPVAAVRSPVAT
jgi:hypothetical protein